jgi:Rab proteins geranylgeranyltransferase component A
MFTFPSSSYSLAFDDSTLEPVRMAWDKVMGEHADGPDYMQFPAREGADDDDDDHSAYD